MSDIANLIADLWTAGVSASYDSIVNMPMMVLERVIEKYNSNQRKLR